MSHIDKNLILYAVIYFTCVDRFLCIPYIKKYYLKKEVLALLKEDFTLLFILIIVTQ